MNDKTLWEYYKIHQLSQRQDSLHDQLSDLKDFAVRLGMYDAAEFIENKFKIDKDFLINANAVGYGNEE
jgi:hypothetical protein